METSSITILVGAFIGFAILIAVGVQILGGVQTATNCLTLPGGLTGTFGTQGSNNVTTTGTGATGWSLSCFHTNSSIQNGYSLLTVAVIVIAAVIIMFVVKML